MMYESTDSTGRWQTKITSLKEGIAHVYETKEFSDVTFRVEEENFKAHRLILGARSSKFANMLLKDYEHDIIIVEKPVTKTGFEILLRFIYTDKLGTTDKKAIIEASVAAHFYAQTALKIKCDEVINSWTITAEEAIKLLDAGSNIPVLQQRCVEFIKNNTLEVLSSSSFFDATFKSICLLLETGSLKNIPAIDCIKKIMEWNAKHKSESDDYSNFREKLINFCLFGLLDFEKLTLAELRDVDFDYPGLLTPQEVTDFMKYEKNKNDSLLPNWSKKCKKEND